MIGQIISAHNEITCLTYSANYDHMISLLSRTLHYLVFDMNTSAHNELLARIMKSHGQLTLQTVLTRSIYSVVCYIIRLNVVFLSVRIPARIINY
jgi:hypothetical protein